MVETGFFFGIIEYVYFPDSNKNQNRKILLEREQYFLDNIIPSLNTNKVAGSMLGFKHTEETKLKFGFSHHLFTYFEGRGRGKRYKINKSHTIIKPKVSKETI